MVRVEKGIAKSKTVLYAGGAETPTRRTEMPTDEIIIRLFCIVADTLEEDKKRSDAHLYPSEIVTIGLVFALKGGKFRPFYRWLRANYRAYFPALPERTRLERLLRDHSELAEGFLVKPSFFSVIDTYGIELIHPRREG